jgi:hypothetical protein
MTEEPEISIELVQTTSKHLFKFFTFGFSIKSLFPSPRASLSENHLRKLSISLSSTPADNLWWLSLVHTFPLAVLSLVVRFESVKKEINNLILCYMLLCQS